MNCPMCDAVCQWYRAGYDAYGCITIYACPECLWDEEMDDDYYKFEGDQWLSLKS